MHLIIGGRYQGKRAYAEKLYPHCPIVYNLASENPANINAPGLITDLHLGVKTLLTEGILPCGFFMSRLEVLRGCVIIGDEIGGGVVPLDEFSRRWRDETGRVYQALAREADMVDRGFAGLALRLKG